MIGPGVFDLLKLSDLRNVKRTDKLEIPGCFFPEIKPPLGTPNRTFGFTPILHEGEPLETTFGLFSARLNFYSGSVRLSRLRSKALIELASIRSAWVRS